MTSILIHRVIKVELTETNALDSNVGTFWRRRLEVTDENGNKTEITLFADSEWQLEIKETV